MRVNNKCSLKIAVAGLRGIPGVMGGVETHCEELYRRLPDSYDVLIYGRRKYCKSAEITKSLRVKSLYSPKSQSLETPIHTLLAMLHCLLFNRVDVFHIHGIGGSFFLPIAKLFFPYVLVTHHSQNYDHQKWGLIARWVFRCGEYFALKYADRVLFVNKSLCTKFSKLYPGSSYKYLFLGNGFSLPDQGVRVDHVKKPFFLAVGRLVPEKGFHDLINAFNQYGGQEALYIAGDADFKSRYVDKLKALAGKNVVFLGKMNKAEVRWLYSNCRTFVLPSYSEGMPISALEAVSCGANILLSDIQQNLDLEFPKESYFKLGDITSLEEKLKFGGFKVNQEFLQGYNWDDIVNKYIGFFEEVVK